MGLVQWLKSRRRSNAPWMLCMRQEDTWNWPPYLDTKTAGTCDKCKTPIYFEAKNAKYRKICTRCKGLT